MRVFLLYKVLDMTSNEILEIVAKERIVEEIIRGIRASRDESTDNLADLAQMIYLVLLEYDSEKIEYMWENGQLRYFISRMLINQISSKTSPYYYTFKKTQKKQVEIDEEKE